MSKIKRYKLSKLYDFSSGISSKPEQAGHGTPFLSFSTIFNNYFIPNKLPDLMDSSLNDQEKYSIKNGDIFLTRTSEVIDELGISCVAVRDYPKATYSGFAKRLRPLQTNVTYARFMAFYLRSKLFRKTMTNNAVLTLRASLNEQIFSYLDLLLPDYSQQVKIGDLLYLLTSKMELNNHTNLELEKITKILYDYWFVQFDFPNKNGKPYKSSGGKMVFNEKLKREIPEGWEVGNLGNVCDIYQPKTISQKDCIEDGKYFVHGSNGIIGKYNEYNHENSEIIVSCRGDCGNIHRTVPKIWITGNAMVFKLKDNTIHNEFLYHALYWLGIKNISSGSVQGQITRTNVSPLKIILPTKDLLKQYSIFAKNIVNKKLLINEENQKLAELRDWLLPMLMNGQVSIK